jgi:HAD superfamily hydrolase (TIGR01490 family)
VAGAAFFDLDRTLLRRSSALALAGPFRRRGLISRTALLRAALWQALFVLRGASGEAVRRAAEEGLGVLRGMTTGELQTLVAESLEPVLRPLVYGEPVALARQHQARGEPVYIVSAALQEIVDELARDLGFDGAIGTVAEVRDGVYTGRTLHARQPPARLTPSASWRAGRAWIWRPPPRTPTVTRTCPSSRRSGAPWP